MSTSTSVTQYSVAIKRREDTLSNRILFIEDDSAIRDLAIIGLKRFDFDVTCVSNGREAQELLLASDDHFDLIVTDIKMPVMGGIEFIKWFRGRTGCDATPIIVYTADSNAVDAAREAGATHVKLKPMEWHEFVKLIKFQFCS